MRELFGKCQGEVFSHAKKFLMQGLRFVVPTVLTGLLVGGCAEWDYGDQYPRVYTVEKDLTHYPPPSVLKMKPVNGVNHAQPTSRKRRMNHDTQPVTMPTKAKALPSAPLTTSKPVKGQKTGVFGPPVLGIPETKVKLGPDEHPCMSPTTSAMGVCGPDGRMKGTQEFGLIP